MHKQSREYQFLMPLVMLYITADLASLVYSYKETHISFVVVMASSIIFPLTYLIGDIVTEVYGYRVAKKMIWYGIVCDFIFGALTYAISLTPSPSMSQYNAYHEVLSPLLRSVSAQTLGILIGAFTNIYFMSKWKVILKGKHFWLRSIGSSIIGEGLALVISVLIALGGVLDARTILYIIMYAYLYKVFFATFIAPVGQLVSEYFKHKEEVDLFYNDGLNPFKT